MASTICFGDEAGGADINEVFTGHVALTLARIISEGAGDDSVALDWVEFDPDADTVGLYHMNEASWSGAANEVIDSSPQSLHGQAVGSPVPSTVAGWLDREGSFDDSNSQYVNVGATSANQLGDVFTIECWTKMTAPSGTLRHGFMARSNIWHLVYRGDLGAGSRYDFTWRDAAAWRVGFYVTAFSTDRRHIAMVKQGTATRFFLDGIWVASQSHGDTSMLVSSQAQQIGGWSLYYSNSLVDEARISTVARYWDNFSPHRYEQGNVVIQYDFTAAQTLSDIAWNATESGDWEGDVYQVWVYDQVAGWVQVGGNSPTSPISGLSNVIGAAGVENLVKVIMDPKADTLQTETPKLLDMTLTYAPLITRFYRPFILSGGRMR